MSNNLDLDSKIQIISASKTRPADTAVYAAGDVIATATSSGISLLTFANAYNGATGYITAMTMVDSANQTTKPDVDLFLFNSVVGDDNDNAPFTPTDAELLDCIGVFSFTGANAKAGDITSGAGGNLVTLITSCTVEFTCAANSPNIYGVAVVRNAYTPVASEVFTFNLHTQQN